MRIISGRFRGRIIKRPKGIRPTQDKVRKALFDILGDIKGDSFLDLYSGSGAIGLEALSAGVKRSVFVEKSRECIKIIEGNLMNLGFMDERASGLSDVEIVHSDAIEAVKDLHKKKRKFEIVFLDPPYYQDLTKKALKTLSCYDIVSPDSFVVCQHYKRDILPEESDDFRLIKQAKYGDSFLSFYRKT